MNGEFTIGYVELPNGRRPAREFIDSLDDRAAARIDAFIERLRIYGNRMQGKFVKKLTDEIFELRVKETPPAEITRAEQLRQLWMRYRNRYTGSQREREAIVKEWGL